MLPEFAKARVEMLNLWNRSFFAGLRGSDPLLSGIPVRTQREGDQASFGGSDVEYKTCSVTFQLPARDGEGMPLAEFIESAAQLGREIAKQQAKGVFEALKEPTPHSTPVHWSGPLTPDFLFSTWQKLEIDIGDDGKPIWPTIVMGPEAMKEINEKMPIWMEDPEFNKKWAELAELKRREFDEREARRRLVD